MLGIGNIHELHPPGLEGQDGADQGGRQEPLQGAGVQGEQQQGAWALQQDPLPPQPTRPQGPKINEIVIEPLAGMVKEIESALESRKSSLDSVKYRLERVFRVHSKSSGPVTTIRRVM